MRKGTPRPPACTGGRPAALCFFQTLSGVPVLLGLAGFVFVLVPLLIELPFVFMKHEAPKCEYATTSENATKNRTGCSL
jgi:hypothetical protein